MNWQTKKQENLGKGGDGGKIFIFSKEIQGNGKIQANGGEGEQGGEGGEVNIISEKNKFFGEVSAKGGTSFVKQKWWEKNWIQLIMLISAILGIIGFIFLFR